MSTHLSKRTIDKLPSTSNPKSQIYLDDERKGLGLIVYPSGRKVFVLQYGKKRRRIKIGDYGTLTAEEARKKAGKLREMVDNGKDPLDERRDRREQQRIAEGRRRNFQEWAEEQIAWAKENRKSYKDFRSLYGKAIARFGDRNLGDLTKEDLKREFDRMTKKDGQPIVANRWITILHAAFRRAVEEGLVEKNPAAGIKKNREHEGRTRVLSDTEYASLIKAIEEHPNEYERAAFLMMTETGARRGEVLNAKWDDIDFDSLLWTMPDTKSGRKQIIPIHENLATTLQTLPRDGIYVVRGKSPFKPRHDLKSAWQSVLKASGIKKHTTLHDLRRTFCVQVARTAGIQIASKLLRHASIRTTEKHYAPVDAEYMREALEKREAAKVVALKKKKTS